MTTWRKSSYSSSQEGCVEVAFVGDTVGIRDTKLPVSPELFFPRNAFRSFVSATTSSR